METFLYNPVTVLEGSAFSFTIELEVAISTYTNFLCVVSQNANEDEETVISKLTKEVAAGYEIGITEVDSTTLLITIPASDLTEVAHAFYDIEFCGVATEPMKFEAPKFFEVKPSKITL